MNTQPQKHQFFVTVSVKYCDAHRDFLVYTAWRIIDTESENFTSAIYEQIQEEVLVKVISNQPTLDVSRLLMSINAIYKNY